MTNINIAELRAIQQAATPGPWGYRRSYPYNSGLTIFAGLGRNNRTIAMTVMVDDQGDHNGIYIAAFNPELTGALLDALERYKGAIMHLTGWTAEELPERMVEVDSWAILRARNTSTALNPTEAQGWISIVNSPNSIDPAISADASSRTYREW